MNNQRLRILLVDDSAVLRTLVLDILSREPDIESVASAADGRQAIDMITADCPDIVITDWEMPCLNGIDLCRWIRNAPLPHYVYTVLLTASTRVAEMTLAFEAGVDDFVSKPFDLASLRASIRAGVRFIATERRLRNPLDRTATVS